MTLLVLSYGGTAYRRIRVWQDGMSSGLYLTSRARPSVYPRLCGEGTFCSSLGDHLWCYTLTAMQARNDDDDKSCSWLVEWVLTAFSAQTRYIMSIIDYILLEMFFISNTKLKVLRLEIVGLSSEYQ